MNTIEEKFPNRLIHEKSPYLRQHANNPVDWYPWGEEAFEEARRKNKPIFLSIGYSTCHWCHVMERESFEDPLVARLLNDAFVCVKVDREERPDIDAVYMSVCQMLSGSGGWPLTIIMTADKKPFFAATYIPKESRFGRPGLLDLIPRIQALWQNQRQELLKGAEEVTRYLQQMQQVPASGALSEDVLDQAFGTLARDYDNEHGGFGRAPKFPTPHNLVFLLRYFHRTGDPIALNMVTHTLDRMRMGGIFDQVGFGFHRYSTDSRWLLPHFEKMLYDQALLTLTYVDAFQVTGRQGFRQTVQEVLAYVLGNMQHPQGGFYSAEDADSEGEEGKFYLWPVDELKNLLTDEEFRFVGIVFGVQEEGNFIPEAGTQRYGENILHLRDLPEQLSRELGISEEAFSRRLEAIRLKLYRARQSRTAPQKDDKILTDWNGLMIAALARAGRALQNPEYVAAAHKAATFLFRHVYREGRLLHRYREGQAAIPAYLDDYACLIWGLVELYEAALDPFYLEKALELTDTVLGRFLDAERGGFFFTASDEEAVLIRKKEFQDGAIPSGNSVMAYNLLRLARMTGKAHLEETAHNLFRALAGQVQRYPQVFTFLLCAYDFALGPTAELVIAAPDDASARPMIQAVQERYLPRMVLLVKTAETAPALNALAPFTQPMVPLKGQATAYLCRNFTCEAPITDEASLVTKITHSGTQQ